jgi:glycosyltransferase involved in cell wall biosynthesis
VRRRFPEKQPEYDLIFANSATSLKVVEKILPESGTPLAVYVHESSYLLHAHGDFAATTRVLRRADVIFAVSEKVRGTLEALIQPTAKVVVASGFVPVQPQPLAPPQLSPDVQKPPNSMTRVVGAVGTMSWYKGSDLFVLVARRVRELLPDHDVRFVWIGQERNKETRRELDHDVKAAGLDGTVQFPGPTDDPTEFLQSLSLLLLPSREDSWPLVMLEAAAQGVPIVCFQEAGGAEEFVRPGGGTAVPYLDVEAMAQATARYLSDPELHARDSRIARELVESSGTPEQKIAKIATELAALHASRLTA